MALTTESKRGSNCSGTDGTANRVLTLTNTMTTLTGGFSVYVNGLQIVPTTEYTVSHLSASSTVTFLNLVYDADYIVVIYLQTGGVPIAGNYCTYTDVYTRTGLSTTEVSTAIVDELIIDAEAELEMLCGRVFTTANAFTEYLSTKDKDLIGNYSTTFRVTHWPIQSVTACAILDDTGTATETFDTISAAEILAGTYESADYWLETMNDPIVNALKPNGKFTLKTVTIPQGTNNVKVAYTYGYATVPRVITDCTASMAGIRAWAYFTGGQYSSVSDYSLGDFHASKGDIYQRGKQNMETLKLRIDALLERIGRKPRTLFFASGGAR